MLYCCQFEEISPAKLKNKKAHPDLFSLGVLSLSNALPETDCGTSPGQCIT
jgi:hypothetical protein